MEIPTFNGHMRIEEVLDWLTEVKCFFEVMEIPESQKVELVRVKLKFRASVWWEQTQSARDRAEKI